MNEREKKTFPNGRLKQNFLSLWQQSEVMGKAARASSVVWGPCKAPGPGDFHGQALLWVLDVLISDQCPPANAADPSTAWMEVEEKGSCNEWEEEIVWWARES